MRHRPGQGVSLAIASETVPAPCWGVSDDQTAAPHDHVIEGVSEGEKLWRLGMTTGAPQGAALYIGDEVEPAVHLQPRELRSLAMAALGVALAFDLEDAAYEDVPYAFAGLRDSDALLGALADSNSASLVGWLEHLLTVRAVLDARVQDYASALGAALEGDVDTLDEWDETAETLTEDRSELLALPGCSSEDLDAWLADPATGPPPFEPKAWRRLQRAESAAQRRA